MSSSGSQRLSRVLFRDDHHHDHDHHNNNAVTEAEAESELDSDLAPGHPHMGCQIISDSDGDRLLDDCMSSCGMHMSEHVDEPSSPFKLTLGPDMTSSPTYIRSVRDLKLLNSPPQTPKSLTRAARCSSGMQVRPSTGAASRTRFSSGRGTKRSYLTPLVANVNPFSPTPSLTTVAVTGHMMHRTSSSSSSATHAATTQGHHNNSSTSTEGHKRVRLSTDGSGHERTLLPAACRLNFNSLTATATKTSAAGAGAADNCSSDSGHVLLNSTDEMSCGVLACELSGGTDSPFDAWSSESDPPIGTRTENGMTGGGGGVAGGGDGMTGSRYVDEFLELDEIGRGTFGTVYKCQHKLDGLVYAVKVSSEPVRGSAKEKRALNEVYAHAVLGKHLRVVHYYSAWVQDER